MMLPTIHLNGTSADRLAEGYRTAAAAIVAAQEALRETAPNGRDYYPQGPNAMVAATAEHVARLARLESVLEELGELYAHTLDRKPVRPGWTAST